MRELCAFSFPFQKFQPQLLRLHEKIYLCRFFVLAMALVKTSQSYLSMRQKGLYKNSQCLIKGYKLAIIFDMLAQKNIALHTCHLCQKIVKVIRALNCYRCTKTYCFPCINKYFPSKANQILPKTEQQALNNSRVSECFSCLQQCVCDNCNRKGSILDLPPKLPKSPPKPTQQTIVQEINPEMGLFKGKKLSEMPPFMQRAYLKKKVIYFKHEVSRPIVASAPLIQHKQQDKPQVKVCQQIEQQLKMSQNCQPEPANNDQHQNNVFGSQTSQEQPILLKKTLAISLGNWNEMQDEFQRNKCVNGCRQQMQQIPEQPQSQLMEEQVQLQVSKFKLNDQQNGSSSIIDEKSSEMISQDNGNEESIAMHRQGFVKRQISKKRAKSKLKIL